MDRESVLEFINSELERLDLELIRFNINKDDYHNFTLIQGQIMAYKATKEIIDNQ